MDDQEFNDKLEELEKRIARLTSLLEDKHALAELKKRIEALEKQIATAP
jgi:hypothetical protein